MTDPLSTRGTAASHWRPQSYNAEANSVHVVAVTENPVRVWDMEKGTFLEEMLLVDGVVLPESRKVPLLDSHNRTSVASILGSARNFEKQDDVLACDVFFSGTEAGRMVAANVKDGHLTDFSVGYMPLEAHYLAEGEIREIGGRAFQGPVKVTTRWELRELSVTAVGADQMATARSLEFGLAEMEPIPADPPPAAGSHGYDSPEGEPEPPPGAAENIPASGGEGQWSRSAASGNGAPERTTGFVDVCFYAFLAVMILFLLRGLV